MRRMVTGALLAFVALTASATSAAAAELEYTGHNFNTKAECEAFWASLHPGGMAPPHECRQAGTGYALWA